VRTLQRRRETCESLELGDKRAGRESVVDVVKELAYEIGDCL
jgi:hypothetical protein